MEEDYEHGGGGGGGGRPKPMNKAAFLSGFNNLKKELSILSPLKHANVVRLFGVSIKPLGLVLELAVRGDLKSVLKLYKEAQNHIQPPAIQCVVSQVMNSQPALLHTCDLYVHGFYPSISSGHLFSSCQ